MKQEKLFDLLKAAVSPCECVKAAKQELLENGFEEIDYTGDWKLVRGGRYVLNHHDTTMFAFTVGSGYNKKDMVRIAAAHYPYLRIKPNPDFMTNSYAQVNVEVYGGPILNTWFDRPLGVAGRVAIKSEDVFNPRMVLYRSKKPVMIIPNLAIHMNRDVNKGVGINNQVDLMPVLDSIPEDERTTDYFLSFLARELSVEKSDIIDSAAQPVTVTPARIRRMESRSLRTANGIEVKIPTELLNAESEVEFLHADDGSISLLIKNVIL